MFYSGGKRPLPLGGYLEGRGTLDAVVVARQGPLPSAREATRWALIVWTPPGPGGKYIPAPVWQYFFSPAEALSASESVDAELVWSVVCVDVPRAPKVDSRTLDSLVHQLRLEAAARRRLEVGRYER